MVLSRGRIRLDTKNATYSFEDLYLNFSNTFKQRAIKDEKLERVLVLGLGLGSIPLMLETQFQQNAQYTFVELDPIVIDLCKKYLKKEILQKSDILQGDAAEICKELLQQGEKYDLIAFDVFLDNVTKSAFRETSFIRVLAGLLNPGGKLFYNTLSNSKEKENTSLDFYREIFSKAFPISELIEVKGNNMLIGQNV